MSSSSIALIMGASEYPHLGLPGGKQFAASAGAMREYFEQCIHVSQTLDLFDSTFSSGDLLEEIANFLTANHKSSTDLFVYYVGHGSFVNGTSYALAIQRTKPTLKHATSIIVEYLAKTIKDHFPGRRIFIILDCCYAAEAVAHFQTEGSLPIYTSLEADLPAEGTSLLLAASRDDVAYTFPHDSFTRFTGALLTALGEIESDGKKESLHSLAQLVETALGNHEIRSRPEVHSPRQNKGDIAYLEVFPSAAALFHEPRLDQVSEGSSQESPGNHQKNQDAPLPPPSAPPHSANPPVLRNPTFLGLIGAGLIISAAIVIVQLLRAPEPAPPSRHADQQVVKEGPDRQSSSDIPDPESNQTNSGETMPIQNSEAQAEDYATDEGASEQNGVVRFILRAGEIVGGVFILTLGLACLFFPLMVIDDMREKKSLRRKLTSGLLPPLLSLQSRQDFMDFIALCGDGIKMNDSERQDLMTLIMAIDDRPVRGNEETRQTLRSKISQKLTSGEKIGESVFTMTLGFLFRSVLFHGPSTCCLILI